LKISRLKTKILFSAFLLCGSLISCGHNNSPEGVAEEFLFRYFIELNQRGALELSTGLATDKLNKEIELTQNIRMLPNLDLAQHKLFYYVFIQKHPKSVDTQNGSERNVEQI